MAASITGKTQPWFTICESLSTGMTAGQDLDARNIRAVAFKVDVNLTIGTLSESFALPANQPMGLDDETTSIQVDVDAFMFAMRRD